MKHTSDVVHESRGTDETLRLSTAEPSVHPLLRTQPTLHDYSSRLNSNVPYGLLSHHPVHGFVTALLVGHRRLGPRPIQNITVNIFDCEFGETVNHFVPVISYNGSTRLSRLT